MGLSKTGNNIKNRQKPNDVFLTPLALSQKAIDMVIDAGQYKTWLDPSRGEGSFFNQFPPSVEKDYCEITEGKDFFEYQKYNDVIIGNPPFSVWDKWLEKTISLKPLVINYVIGCMNLTPRRIEMFNDAGYGITKFHIVTVKKWFGQIFLIQLEKDKENIITFDRVCYK